jgi:hypothetical protein
VSATSWVSSPLGVGGGALGFVAQEPGPLHRVIPAPLGVAQLGLQAGAVGGRALGAFTQGGELSFERRSLALQGPQGLGERLQLLLPLAHSSPGLAQTTAHVILGLGPAGELAPDPIVLDGRGVPVGGGSVPLAQGDLGADLHLGALLLRALAARARVGQPLGHQREVAVDPAELDPDRAEPAFDLGPLGFRGGAGSRRLFALVLAVGQPVARGGEEAAQLAEPRLHPRGLLAQALEQAARQRHLHGKLLLGEPGVALGLAALPRQAPDLRLHFGDQIFHPLEIGRGLLEAPLGAVLPVPVQPDAGGLLEQRPPLVGAIGQQQVDHLGLDDDAGVAAEAGAPKQILDVPQAHRRAVEEVVALAGA